MAQFPLKKSVLSSRGIILGRKHSVNMRTAGEALFARSLAVSATALIQTNRRDGATVCLRQARRGGSTKEWGREGGEGGRREGLEESGLLISIITKALSRDLIPWTCDTLNTLPSTNYPLFSLPKRRSPLMRTSSFALKK